MADQPGCIYHLDGDDTHCYCLIRYFGNSYHWRKFCPAAFNDFYRAIYYVDEEGRVADPLANGRQLSMVDMYLPENMVEHDIENMTVCMDSRFTPRRGDLWYNDTDRVPYAFDVASYNPESGRITIVPLNMHDPTGYPYFEKTMPVGPRPFRRIMDDTTFWILVGLAKIKLYRPPCSPLRVNDSFRVKVSYSTNTISSVNMLMLRYYYNGVEGEFYAVCSKWVFLLLHDVSERGLLAECETPARPPRGN